MPTSKAHDVGLLTAHGALNKSSVKSSKNFSGQQSNRIENQCAGKTTPQLSVHHLEFPQPIRKQPRICVTKEENVDLCPDMEFRMFAKYKKPPRERGKNISSSSNSAFEGNIFTVPNAFKPVCIPALTTPKSTTQYTARSSTSSASPSLTSSKRIKDSAHKISSAVGKFHGDEFKKPCSASLKVGQPHQYIGTCPPTHEQLAKMSRSRQKFFLTQDPRKKYCLVNPKHLYRKDISKKEQFEEASRLVKQADNICFESQSEKSDSFICDIIDEENPMQLDFQGEDYKNTYEQDEQDLLNQGVYRRVCRYINRKKMKQEISTKVEEELRKERLDVPQCFEVPDRNDEVKSTTTAESVRYGKIFRSADKPYNQMVINQENERRHQRYKHLYLANKAKMVNRQEEEKKMQERQDEMKVITTADQNFRKVLENINDAIHHSFKQELMLRRKETQKRIFPHTIRETLKFRQDLKVQDRILRDKAKLKKEFYEERFGKEKILPEAELEISEINSRSSNISEQSTDDEDLLQVGKIDDKIQLRGFHYKMGSNLRGKTHQHEKLKERHREKTCMSREQWLAELAPRKEPVRIDIEEGIDKNLSPDDPNLLLFNKPRKKTFHYNVQSAVRQYRSKSLGRHYDRVLRKNLKMVKPKLRYKAKKFNLISYLYGSPELRIGEDIKEDLPKNDEVKISSTIDYIMAKQRDKRKEKEMVKNKRLKLLGLPCREVVKSRLQMSCENSSESESDWVTDPEAEPLSDVEEEFRRIAEAKAVRVPYRLRGNMPAPKYRETTFRRHPRKPRDYAGLRVPSAVFVETVNETGVPHLLKTEVDQLIHENVRMKKRKFTELFEARHHHDHWEPTQRKTANVHYRHRLAKPKVVQQHTKLDKELFEHFKMANPPCNQFIDMDLSMPQSGIDSLVAEYMAQKSRVKQTDTFKMKDLCTPKDFIFHSRPEEELKLADFPGRQEYLNFLHEVRDAMKLQKTAEKGEEKQYVDKTAYIKELEEDLKSIETCLTSLSSSDCTNLTNDSGSFLLVEGKTKIALDHIRKSVIPFEEMQRSRFRAEVIDVDKENANPYNMMPFSGQRKAQMALVSAKDTFFTFNTRLKNGLRLRLEVPVEDVRKKLIGCGKQMHAGLVATDIDENYVSDLKTRPPVKTFNFKSGTWMIKDALRMKFESMLIQGQLVRTKIYDRLNELNWQNMLAVKELYEKLFTKWEKREYENAMSVVYKVKSYYDTTDQLRNEFRNLEREQVVLNMEIVFMESHWIRRIMLQNFHYLLGDQEWRYKHDWIHRVEGNENELESFEQSIAKRSTANIRNRDKDDAWAIKDYYEQVYLRNKHPILIVFPDANSFLQGIDNLKSKTFVLLLELHFTLSIATELQGRLEMFKEWCLEDLKEKEAYVERKCAKKYFMADRATDLRNRTLEFLGDPVEDSFNDPSFNKERAVITEVWRHIVPTNIRGSKDQELEPTQMVAMMSDVILELLAKFEDIPVQTARAVEANLRKSFAYRLKMSQEAYTVEKRIESEMKNVHRNMTPYPIRACACTCPTLKHKTDRYKRMRIKKKIVKEIVPEVHISEHTRFFFRAFHEEGDAIEEVDARETLGVADDLQEQIVPFYFDHFLKLNGYTPNYNFKTQTEIRDGPEIDRVQIRTHLPQILEKMDVWETNRQRVMEDNIARNPKMYENVNT